MKPAHLYTALLAVRAICAAWGWGFVHPDEWFQSAEVSARDVLHVRSTISWEYGEVPSRSFLNLLTSSTIPFFLAACWSASPTPQELLLAIRCFCWLKSLLLDASVVVLARHLGVDPTRALLLLASSWAVMVLAVRPFSNATEAILLAGGLVTAVSKANLSVRLVSCGALMAVGFWTRITFPGFFLPVCVWLVFPAAERCGTQWVARVLASGCTMVLLGFVPMASLLCLCDSIYFKTIRFTLAGQPVGLWDAITAPTQVSVGCALQGCFVVAPLANLLYNMDSASLAEHGLHPWYTHLLLNQFLLFGLLPILALLYPKHCALSKLLLACAYCGLAIMSLAPHQEPRFLLPMVVPFALLASAVQMPRLGIATTVMFNLVLTLFFGFLHQSGVVPAVVHLKDAPAHTHAVFFRTYPPPQHLLLQSTHTPATVVITDAQGNATYAQEALAAIAPSTRAVVVVPGTVPSESLGLRPGEWTVQWRIGGHVSTQSLPQVWTSGVLEQLSLIIYQRRA
eukprot:TRINITY_DN18666_c0_g1_i2.p1 TRINITY_DN18666_c0_g1~~TRINITY_DN18666_c0_g1_i2.p1  ORF type:complete len:511 (+),score=81.90 TRINITY_DN18666_c0_g1_i2:159-1691(+)